MKPMIETIKEKYKDAKEVKSLCYRGETIDVSNPTKYDIRKDSAWIDTKNDTCKIWDSEQGFAEIISYKTPKLEIDKDLILKIADKCPSCKDDLKKEFPSVFEVKLEVGKWYKFRTGTLGFFKGINVISYGFHIDNNEWFDDQRWFFEGNKNDYCNCVLATPSEILSALQKEAEKRGLVEGATIKNHQGTFKLGKLDIVYSEKYNNGIWTRQGKDGIWLFINGTWATPIQTVTQKEILDFYKSEKGITNEIIVEG